MNLLNLNMELVPKLGFSYLIGFGVWVEILEFGFFLPPLGFDFWEKLIRPNKKSLGSRRENNL
jgi:hypothetical protein